MISRDPPRGDQALFVSAAELVEAWRIFTPLLHQIDDKKPQPVVHPFGALPVGYAEWAKQRGVELQPTWQEYVVTNGDKVDEMKRVFAELDKDNTGTLDRDEMTELAKRAPGRTSREQGPPPLPWPPSKT